MDYTAFQKKNLDRIFLTASFPPIFKSNDKYCKGKLSRAIPFISYDDAMNWEYIIRAGDSLEDDIENYKAMDCPVIIQYNSIEDLVHDGWRLD